MKKNDIIIDGIKRNIDKLVTIKVSKECFDFVCMIAPHYVIDTHEGWERVFEFSESFFKLSIKE